MKTTFRKAPVLALLTCIVILGALSWGCKKKTDNNNDTTHYSCWGENWLIGTWEGTTPTSVSPFGGTKIRIVFDNAVLKTDDAVSGNPRKVWAYNGTLTWDVGGATEWSYGFTASNYPSPDYGVIIYECMTISAINQAVSNISIRVGDTVQVTPLHSVDLDWGIFTVNSSTPPTSFKVYGDVELDWDGTIQRADYVPDESEITMTKK